MLSFAYKFAKQCYAKYTFNLCLQYAEKYSLVGRVEKSFFREYPQSENATLKGENFELWSLNNLAQHDKCTCDLKKTLHPTLHTQSTELNLVKKSSFGFPWHYSGKIRVSMAL